MADTFCPIPWNFQAIRSNGDVRLCCQANISQDQGVLRRDDGTTYNAKDGRLDLSRNSALIKRVRTNMLANQWDPSCMRCQQEEASQLSSRRKYELEQWSLRKKDALLYTEADGTINKAMFPVEYYDLRFGNLCNLKCRMCGPADSSAWYEDWVALTGSHEFKDTSGKVTIKEKDGKLYTDDYSWPQSDIFWKDIEKRLDSVKHIYMAGGEPLLIKKHYDFLEKCIAQKVSSQIVLEYNTNVTQVPDKALSLWQHFKQVRIGASIDGYGSFAEYQRYPCRWPQIYENLKILNDQPLNIFVWIAYTVTAYNVFHLVDFIKWKLTCEDLRNINRTERRPIITPHMAHHPKHLNIRVLPSALKQDLKQEFVKLNLWIKSQGYSAAVCKQGMMITSSIEEYMLSQDYNEKHWGTFCSYTRRLDEIRGQNILDLVPKFSNYMGYV